MIWIKFVVLFGLFAMTSAIKCYHCDSRFSLTCKGKEFEKSENLIEEDEFSNKCKYCTTSSYPILGSKVVQRRCETEDFDFDRYGLKGKNDCASSWFYTIEGEICVCNSNKCNSAGMVIVSMVTLTISLLVSRLLS